jgi:hypothetical protein
MHYLGFTDSTMGILLPYRNTFIPARESDSYPAENVFLYGGTAGIRTQNWQIKSLL